MLRALFKLLLFSFFILSTQLSFSSEEYYGVPCEVKECNPKLGTTATKWYKGDGDKKKPAIMWFAGGPSTSLALDYQPIILLKGKFDIIMVASPLPIITNKQTNGFPKNSYKKEIVFRMKQVTEYYKKKLGKPIWLGGTSAGGPRMVGVLIGNEKDRPSDRYAGLIFATPYLARIAKSNGMPTGQFSYNIRVSSIKYKMNLPILVFQHKRDLKTAQAPPVQKAFTNQLSKKNEGKTELILLTEGDPRTTDYDGPGSHHWFSTNLDEVARVVSKFIMDNTN